MSYASVNPSFDCRNGSVPAVILAGGYGFRLGGLTRDTPKPMLKIAGRPVLEHVLEHLKDNGIDRAVFSLHYLPETIRGHFKGGADHGVDLTYFVTPVDLGTAGGVRGASRLVVGDHLLIVSGDVLTGMNLREMIGFHLARKAGLTMALTSVEDGRPYGVVQMNSDDRIRRFVEKPTCTTESPCWVNAGIYVIRRELIELIPERGAFDISRDLVPLLMSRGEAVYGFRARGYWFDIGTPRTLRGADACLCALEINQGAGSINAAALASANGTFDHATGFISGADSLSGGRVPP